MKFVIQRVTQASVQIDEIDPVHPFSTINNGLVVLIGVCNEDDRHTADKMIRKMLNMRIFEDENGKTNLALREVNGNLLLISQFTLYADCRKGNRPSFVKAGSPEHAEKLYDYMVEECRKEFPDLQTGKFGAKMMVSLINDGPFTIVLDSAELS